MARAGDDSSGGGSSSGDDPAASETGDAGGKSDPGATRPRGNGPAPQDCGADSAGADPTPAEVAAEEQAWDEAMHQAASLAKAEGKLPGAIAETVRGAHAVRLDWRALLRRFLADSAKSDYSWSAPNPRFIDGGLYLPSLRAEGMDTLAVIIDTSGSLPAETLADFWTELRAAAEIHDRGGTNFRPGFAWLEKPAIPRLIAL